MSLAKHGKWVAAWSVLALFAGFDEARAAVIAANDGTNFDWLVIDSAPDFDDAAGSFTKVNYFNVINENDAWHSGFRAFHDSSLGTLGSDSATYTFKGLANGIYAVGVSYSIGGNRATDAPYSIDGGTPILVNQRIQANDMQLFQNSNASINHFFELISTTALVTDGDLQVVLGDSTSGFAIADAVAIRFLSAAANPVPEPNTVILAGCGLLGLVGLLRLRRRRNPAAA